MSKLRILVLQVRARPRLTIAAAVGVLALWLLPPRFAAYTRQLLAWDIGMGLYLALAWIMMARASLEHMRSRARRQDEGAAAVLVLSLLAAVASLAAIVLELSGVKEQPTRIQVLHLALAAATIVCSWLFVHTSFALHYAHEYYAARGEAHQPGLEFPGQGQPNYRDFLYFSFVIGSTSQTADVPITSSRMRGLALLHGVAAFFFNTTLLALTINIAAGLL